MSDDINQDISLLANKYSATRVKISTFHFDREYKLLDSGEFALISMKAIIRSYGTVRKVPVGENEKFSTFEEAKEAVQNEQREYYKKVRRERSDEEKQAEKKRQRRYRTTRQQEVTDFKQKQ